MTFWGGAERAAAIIHAWLLTRSDGPWRVHHEVTAHTKGNETGRMDLWALRVSWARLEAWAFEIKVNRSDFQKDVDAGKWRKYLSACNRFWWVTPKDLVRKSEIPEGTGLIYVGGGVEVVVRPTIRKWQPSWTQLAGLLFSIDTPLSSDMRDRYSRKFVKPPPETSRETRRRIAHDRMVRRESQRKLVETYTKELETKIKEIKELDQLKANDYVKKRMLDVVCSELGLYNFQQTMTEDEMREALKQNALGVRPQIDRNFRALARTLGYEVSDLPAR